MDAWLKIVLLVCALPTQRCHHVRRQAGTATMGEAMCMMRMSVLSGEATVASASDIR